MPCPWGRRPTPRYNLFYASPESGLALVVYKADGNRPHRGCRGHQTTRDFSSTNGSTIGIGLWMP